MTPRALRDASLDTTSCATRGIPLDAAAGAQRGASGALHVPAQSVRAPARGADLFHGLSLFAIVLVALNLRPLLTSVGPLLGDIRLATGMSYPLASLLTALPVMSMGALVFAGIALGRRIGARHGISAGLAAIGLACLWRYVAADAASLIASAGLAGLGVALVQALLPGVIKAGFPRRMVLIMGVYTAAMMGGGGLGAVVSPWVAHVSGSWQLGLGLWALPAFMALACWAWKRPQPLLPGSQGAGADKGTSAVGSATVTGVPDAGTSMAAARTARPAAGSSPAVASATGFPASALSMGRPVAASPPATEPPPARIDTLRQQESPIRPPYRAPRAWLLALYFGALNGGYASMVAWLPVFYVQRGWSIQQGGWLLGLMTALQVVAALVLPGLARRGTDRRPWLGVGLGAQLLGFAGLAISPDTGAVFWVSILGFGLGGSFALCMILALDHLDDPWRAGRLAAFMQAIGFMIAALAPMLSGWVRDATGGFRTAWAIQAIVVLLLLGVTLIFRPSGYARAMQGPVAP